MKYLFTLIIFWINNPINTLKQSLSTDCGSDLTEITKTLQLKEGENLVCTAENGSSYYAIVLKGNIVDWKIKDASGKNIQYSSEILNEGNEVNISSKKKGSTKPSTTTNKIPVKITICEIIGGKKTTNCRTVIKA